MKEKIYLTDITLHTKDFRQTMNFSRVAIKGRMYSPLPKDYHLANQTNDKTSTKGNTFKLSITLPPDLQAKLDRGEVELMMPKDGLLIYAGKDFYEKIAQTKAKERRELIHRNRDNVWHKW